MIVFSICKLIKTFYLYGSFIKTSFMKNKLFYLFITIIILCIPEQSFSQKNPQGADVITAADLESYVSFLASPLLKGRKNGEPGLEIAQQFIVSQAKVLGLKPANGSSYLQPYILEKTVPDPEKTLIHIIGKKNDTITIRKPILQIRPSAPSDYTLEGEVVFAGYGLRLDKYQYDDLGKIEAEGKILLIMAGAPSNPDGKYLFEGTDWGSYSNIRDKIMQLMLAKPKAILIVMGPKSGFSSVDQWYPGISGEMRTPLTLKGENNRFSASSNMPRVIFVDRSVAEGLLRGSGKTLADLQNKIDAELKPNSFLIPDKRLILKEAARKAEVTMHNVAAMIEGSDPVLKNEYVIFSGHADHIGENARGIYPGADDDASGCAALLSMAEAFQSLEVKPLRSILFLWVSGEEIGLYGSRSYVNNPIVPLDKTVADLNMDMIGRNKGIADTTSDTPMTGPHGIFVITDNQSRELLAIAGEADKNSVIDFDYSLSGRNHPLQLFTRSDHYNFVRKDIPVLFFLAGLHSDYHTTGDVVEKIDFKKMELVTKTMFQIGYEVANRKTRIVVDNPFSKW